MTRPASARWFGWGLAGVAALGLAIRLIYIFGWHQHDNFGGDSLFYHAGANLLADGKGFISPFAKPTIQAGDHPPLYMTYLAIPSFFGLRSVLTHQLASALLGMGTVILVGLTGREISGPRLGIIAALFAALYPNVWGPDALLRAESMAMLTIALTLYVSYRYWHSPTWRWLAAVGAACALATLARSELVLLFPLLIVPLVVLAPVPTRKERWQSLGAAALVAFVIMAPWVIFNLTRFEKPEVFTTSTGPLIASSNCDAVYNGNKSYFSVPCTFEIYAREDRTGLDQSEIDAVYRQVGIKYIKDHLDQVPGVVVARLRAMVGLYNPTLQINIDSGIDGSEHGVATAAFYSFWVIALLSIAGAIVLRRRRTTPVFPLLVVIGVVVITVAVSYFNLRFRATAEVALCILAALAIDGAINAVRGRNQPETGPEETTNSDAARLT